MPRTPRAATVWGVYQVRIHGRGGQGVVTAAELLSVAAFDEGRYAQAFPTFGSERTGAPVISFCRIDDRPIRVREPIFDPDVLIVQDPTLLRLPGLLGGLKPGGAILVNTHRSPEELDLQGRVLTVNASAIAREHVGRPLPNAALLGGLSALEGIVGLDALAKAIREKFPPAVAEANVRAAIAAHDVVEKELQPC